MAINIKKKIFMVLIKLLRPILKILLKKRIEERRRRREQEVLSFVRKNVREAMKEHDIIALDSLPD